MVFKKMLPWVIMIFVVITLIVFVAILLWNNLFTDSNDQDPNAVAKNAVEQVEPQKMSAQETKELSVEINDILTNLSTGEYLKVSFTFELNNLEAKEEFTLIDFKIRALIILTLADLTPEDIQGSAGKDLISAAL